MPDGWISVSYDEKVVYLLLAREMAMGSTARMNGDTAGDGRLQWAKTAGRLRELVGRTAVGSRIPGERELAQRWQVARMTLRRAVDALIAEGLLDRRHGSGTYVLPRPCVRMLGLTSFTRDMRQRGMEPSTAVLTFGRQPADDDLARELDVAVGTGIVHFSRLRLADGAPMAVETVWLPDGIVPGLNPTDLNGSFYALLQQRYRSTPASAKVSIEPAIPAAAIRRELQITESQPCLRIQVTSSDITGRTFMYSSGYYRGDRYQLRAELLAGAFAAAARGVG